MAKHRMFKTLTTAIACLVIIASMFLPSNAQAAISVSDVTPQLTASVQSDSQVNLQWSIPAGVRLSGFEIERSSDPLSGYAAVLSASKSDSTILDQSVQPGQAYYYRVRAFRSSRTTQYSAYSNVEFAELKITAPIDSTPPSVSLTNPSDNAVFTSQQTIDLSATALDDTGVVRVDFYRDDVLVGSDSAALIQPVGQFRKLKMVSIA